MNAIKRPQDLHGLWAAIPTPWDESHELDPGVLERNVERYAGIPIDGVYTTDSDGEFYAIELDEFRVLIRHFAAAMEKTEMAAAVGVTWINTRGIVDRIRVCLDCGITAVKVAFPFWMPLSRDDVPRFWEDLARAAPEARWVHYNSHRAHITFYAGDYRWLADTHPENLIGTKLPPTLSDMELVKILETTPELAHFVTDPTTVPGYMMGAKGSYSYWVNTLPQWTKRMTDLCRERRWEEAMAMQRRLLVWEATYVRPLRESGYNHGTVGKARGALTGFLEDSGLTRAPYYPVADPLWRDLKAGFDVYWAGEE